MINYFKILKESFNLVFKHKYLWFLGLFLGGGIGSNYSSYFSNWDSESFEQKYSGNIISVVSANVKDAGQVLGEKVSANISNTEWLFVTTIIILLIIALIYVGVTAKGAATWAVVKLQSGVKFDLKDAWDMGQKFFWRKLSYDIIICASMIVIIALLATPIITLAIFELIIPAIILGILFGLALIALLIYLSLFLPYSERVLFLENKKNFQAIFGGFKLFNKNWPNLVLMYLILLGINLLVAVSLIFAVIMLGLIAFGIGAAFYFINHITGYVIGGTLGLVILIALITLSGALNSFYWSAITLTYKEVK